MSNYNYGPAGFVSAIVNIFVLNFYLWFFSPYVVIGYPVFLPVILVDLAVSVVLARRAGTVGQVGRGMLIGVLSVPVALAVFIPAFIVAHAIGA